MTQRLAILLAAFATAGLTAAALPAPAAAATKVNCQKLNGKALVRVILKRRCAGGFAARGGAKVRLTVTGNQTTDWSESYENRLRPGTPTECNIASQGSGRQVVAFGTRTLTAYVYSTNGRSLELDTALNLRGTVKREGTRRETMSGPGCAPEENVSDTSGCGSRDLAGGGHAIGVAYARGRVVLSSPGFQRTSDRIDPCPFSTHSERGRRFVTDAKDRFDPVKVAPAVLLGRRSVAVIGADSDVEHQGCDVDPSACPQGVTFRNDAATALRWKVTIRR